MLQLLKLETRERFVAAHVGLNFGCICTLDYKEMIHMKNPNEECRHDTDATHNQQQQKH
jgi:hypothetical protein